MDKSQLGGMSTISKVTDKTANQSTMSRASDKSGKSGRSKSKSQKPKEKLPPRLKEFVKEIKGEIDEMKNQAQDFDQLKANYEQMMK